MHRDSFIDQYIKLVQQEIVECKDILCGKSFENLAEVSKVQGKLQGLTLALNLLAAIPEEP